MEYDPYDKDSKILDIAKQIIWPERKFTIEEVRAIFRSVNRFIDCDGTIFLGCERDESGEVIEIDGKPIPILNPTLCGKPIEEFLREEPFIVQTQGTFADELWQGGWLPASFPKPVLIIVPPIWYYNPDKEYGKNFAALGITGATIIDDEPPETIHAPGCIVLPPNN